MKIEITPKENNFKSYNLILEVNTPKEQETLVIMLTKALEHSVFFKEVVDTANVILHKINTSQK